MRFIVDECTGPFVAEWLRASGHEVFSVYEEARGLGDDEVITAAYYGDYILITNDRLYSDHKRQGLWGEGLPRATPPQGRCSHASQ